MSLLIIKTSLCICLQTLQTAFPSMFSFGSNSILLIRIVHMDLTAALCRYFKSSDCKGACCCFQKTWCKWTFRTYSIALIHDWWMGAAKSDNSTPGVDRQSSCQKASCLSAAFAYFCYFRKQIMPLFLMLCSLYEFYIGPHSVFAPRVALTRFSWFTCFQSWQVGNQ